jgi:serine/threonine protein phosphatase PrpC
MTSFRLTYGLATEIGYMRTVNCDTAVARIWPNGAGLFVVAAGLLPDGKAASQFACEIVMHKMDTYFQDISHLPINNIDKTFSILKAAIHTANRAVFAQTPESGTTFTAGLVIGASLYVTHVGDSRAYLISINDTQRLTIDHTYSHELIRRGYITEEQLRTYTIKETLFRALGQTESLEVDTQLTNIIPNTWLLLCTKGLISWNWGMISQEEIYVMISQNDPQTASDMLVALAKARDSYHDISAIVIKFDPV